MKAKKLTLNETWRLCLSMWRWIAKQVRMGSETAVVWDLKYKWLNKNWTKTPPKNECFFCEYTKTHYRKDKASCQICPGALVEKQFRCDNRKYHYKSHPIAFYNKLRSLNRKRLQAKRR